MAASLDTSFQGKQLTLISVLFGLAGGLIGWLLGEIQQGSDEELRFFNDSLHLGTGVWFAFVLVGIGSLIVLSDSYNQKNYDKFFYNLRYALPVFVVAGFLAGVIAQEIFESMLDYSAVDQALQKCIYKEIYECTEIDNVVRPSRAVGWLTAGALAGAGVGLTYRSKKRVQNGFIGGAAGGLLGGLIFDSVDNILSTTSSTGPRAIALVIMGSLIGGLIALVNALRTDLWLTVRSGEMTNKQFVIYDDETLVGTARNIPVTILADPTISEHHLKITKSGGLTSFQTFNNASPVVLNGNATTSGNLKDGDTLIIGNTEISVGEKTSSTSSQPLQNQQNFPVSGERERPNIYKDTNETSTETGSSERKTAPPPKPPVARPTIQMKPKE
jgi:hypothetical protein